MCLFFFLLNCVLPFFIVALRKGRREEITNLERKKRREDKLSEFLKKTSNCYQKKTGCAVVMGGPTPLNTAL